jgi:hypothetical protein
MTTLRQRMIEEMQLCGLAKCTQDEYVFAVRQLAEQYNNSLDQIVSAELVETSNQPILLISSISK